MQEKYNVSSNENIIYLGSEIPIDEICGALGIRNSNTEIIHNSYWKCIVVEVDDFMEAHIVLEKHCGITEKKEMIEAVTTLYPNRYKDIIFMQKRNLQLN